MKKTCSFLYTGIKQRHIMKEQWGNLNSFTQVKIRFKKSLIDTDIENRLMDMRRGQRERVNV